MPPSPRKPPTRGHARPARHDLLPGSPLWQRAPSRVDGDRPACDFLLLVPGLGGRAPEELRLLFGRVDQALQAFGDRVLMADFNARLNLLWISHRPEPGLGGDLRDAITAVLPGAKLVAQPFATAGKPALNRPRGWLRRLTK